jgi:hypothetical protein
MAVASAIAILLNPLHKTCLPYKAECLLIFALCLTNPAIVLLSNGIDAGSENKLRNYFSARNPCVIIIQHYGGGSGLLKNEILQALDAKTMLKEEKHLS